MSNHVSDNVSICLIDKTDPADPHKRDYYWMRTLKTIAPFGLNTKKNTVRYIQLHALHQSNQIILLLKVCKSECRIATFLLSWIICYLQCQT